MKLNVQLSNKNIQKYYFSRIQNTIMVGLQNSAKDAVRLMFHVSYLLCWQSEIAIYFVIAARAGRLALIKMSELQRLHRIRNATSCCYIAVIFVCSKFKRTLIFFLQPTLLLF